MNINNTTPLIDEQTLNEHLKDFNAGHDLPIEAVLRDELPRWSKAHAKLFKNLSTAGNGPKVYKTLVGYPKKVGFTTRKQCEAQIVEFVQFYQPTELNPSRSEITDLATNLIRATPIADLNSEFWKNDEKAEARVSDFYDFIIEQRETTESGDKSKPSPQDLSNVNLPSSNRSSYEERMADTKKELLGN